MTLAIVAGDDVLQQMRSDVNHRNYRNLDTTADLSTVADRLMTANAYVGSMPIVEALRGGADIVITGRVADPSLTVAACIHHFGWSESDWNRLAGATVAGHLIECGTQVTGGISTEWLSIPDPAHIGFPIVEVAADGSCIVTKPSDTGGVVNSWTVKEQLLYEIGDPANYLSPDVAVSFLSLQVEDVGPDRVRVSGATGCKRPATLKVSATYRDGYRAAGLLTIMGENTVEKADRCARIVIERLQDAGFTLRNWLSEYLGGGDGETVMRIAVEADSRGAIERFAKEVMPLITAGPPGTTGYAEGRPKVHPVIRYWPCLVDRDAVPSRVEYVEVVSSSPHTPAAGESVRMKVKGRAIPKASSFQALSTSDSKTLRDMAFARSGDKGSGANIGVIARRPDDYAFLRQWLTAERVADFFSADDVESAVRYELPNLHAFNFVLRGVLKQSLQIDAQGKALGQRLLRLPLPKKP